jgi:hypothetical protein
LLGNEEAKEGKGTIGFLLFLTQYSFPPLFILLDSGRIKVWQGKNKYLGFPRSLLPEGRCHVLCHPTIPPESIKETTFFALKKIKPSYKQQQ